MSGILDQFDNVVAISDEHLQGMFDFPIDISHTKLTEGKDDIQEAKNNVHNSKWNHGADAIRYFKQGTTAAKLSSFEKKLAKFNAESKALDEVILQTGHDFLNDVLHKFTFKHNRNICVSSNQHIFLGGQVTLSMSPIKSSVSAKRASVYYDNRLKSLQSGKSKTKSCKHCGKRHVLSQINVLDVLICSHCQKELPFDTPTECNKRLALSKKVEAKREKLLSLKESLVKMSPYVFFIEHAYPEPEDDEYNYD